MQSNNSTYSATNAMHEKQSTIAFFQELLHTSIYFTTSCTSALELAGIAIGIQPGDEVITACFTYAATAEVIALLHLKPVLVDVDPDTFNINYSKLYICRHSKRFCKTRRNYSVY